MNNKNQQYFFFSLVGIAVVLAVLIFLPYLTYLILAIVAATIFKPLHVRVAKLVSKGNTKSSFATCITLAIVAVIIAIPGTFLAMRLSGEAQNIYFNLTDETERSKIINTLNDTLFSLSMKLFGYYPTFNFNNFDITQYANNFLSWSFTNIDTVFSTAVKVFLNSFIFLFAMFYMLRDGTTLKKQIIAISPLLDVYDEQIFNKLEITVRSVVQGSLIVSAIQGFLTGFGFWIFGIPNSALWGTVAVIAALIPGFGTSLVLIPGIIYLFATHATIPAAGLLIWSLLAVGLVDNFLSPLIINRGIHVHQFLVLLSVLGGLSFFGPIGFLLGPLIISFLFTLLEIFKTMNRKKELQERESSHA